MHLTPTAFAGISIEQGAWLTQSNLRTLSTFGLARDRIRDEEKQSVAPIVRSLKRDLDVSNIVLGDLCCDPSGLRNGKFATFGSDQTFK